MNETLWSLGVAFMNQCYSTCGLDVVPATNISSTLINLSSVVYHSLGVSVGILMGQMLGARKPEKQRSGTSTGSSSPFPFLWVSSSVALWPWAPVSFPNIYNTTDTVRALAQDMILISALVMPFQSFANATDFTLRSGGKTFITFLFDSGFMWICSIPLAFCLSRFTALPILPLFAICQMPDVLKCVLGSWMLKKGSWIHTLT